MRLGDQRLKTNLRLQPRLHGAGPFVIYLINSLRRVGGIFQAKRIDLPEKFKFNFGCTLNSFY